MSRHNRRSEMISDSNATINSIIYLPAEAARYDRSDTFENFCDLGVKRIIKVLDLPDNDERLASEIDYFIEEEKDNNFAYELCEMGKDGVILEVFFSVLEKFIFDKDGEYSGATISNCAEIEYVYGDTIEKAINKFEDIHNAKREKWIKKEKEGR